MGQAVADLPDPLQSSTPAEAQSADDLLSQLAGDEIDRLLAESDGEPAPAAKVPELAPPLSPSLSPQLQPEPPAEPAIPAPAAVPAASADEVAPAPVESVDLDAVLDTAVAESVERSALHGTAAPAIAEPIDNSPQIELGEGAKRVPLLLRPLEWLSSPLDPWPDQLREILGKVGLMTMINALAVLAYVLLVRRHHH